MINLLVVFLMLVFWISCFAYNPNFVPLTRPYTPKGNVTKEIFGDKLYYSGKILNDISENYNNSMSSELTDIVFEILSEEKPYTNFGCDFTLKEIIMLFMGKMMSTFPDGAYTTYFEITSKDSFIMILTYYHDKYNTNGLEGAFPYTALYFKIDIKRPLLGGEYFNIEELGMIKYYGKNKDIEIVNPKEMAESLLKNYDEFKDTLKKYKN